MEKKKTKTVYVGECLPGKMEVSLLKLLFKAWFVLLVGSPFHQSHDKKKKSIFLGMFPLANSFQPLISQKMQVKSSGIRDEHKP